MNEARYSANIKFYWDGFDVMFTMRTEDDAAGLLRDLQVFVASLRLAGATPTQKANGGVALPSPTNSGHAQPTPVPAPRPETPAAAEQPPTCPQCKSAAAVSRVEWTDKGTGRQRSEWKCTTCDRWITLRPKTGAKA